MKTAEIPTKPVAPVFDTNLYGQPKGTTYTIGFTNVYYTLWMVTRFQQFENVHYIQNLSMDFGKAQRRLVEITGHADFDVDLDLRGDQGWSFFRPLAAKHYTPELLAISRLAGTDMRTMDPNEVYKTEQIQHRDGTEIVEKKKSGLLWATYLNKEEATVRGLRRRVIARQCLAKAGLLVKHNGKYVTPEVVKREQIKLQREAATNGHHFEDGARVTLNVKRLGKTGSFETAYGTTYIMNLIDDQNRLFKYMGGNPPEINEETFTTIKGTVKLDNYKGVEETKIQRIKVIEQK